MALHAEKETGGGQDDMSYGELLAWLRQWKDPDQLIGRSIDDADIDEESGELRCRLSDGSVLDIKPTAVEAEDDPPYRELISPAGVVLEFGPGVRWQISGADAQASRR
jgi:hypothetical protein